MKKKRERVSEGKKKKRKNGNFSKLGTEVRGLFDIF